ncbi:ComEA family DNA-binding protein [Planctomycetota bacterium]
MPPQYTLGMMKSEAKAAAHIGLCLLFVVVIIGLIQRELPPDSHLEEHKPRDFQFVIELNSAPAWKLIMIPGIGEKKARAIVDYRNRKGPFSRMEDLDNVLGIGPHTIDLIRPYCVLRNPPGTYEEKPQELEITCDPASAGLPWNHDRIDIGIEDIQSPGN